MRQSQFAGGWIGGGPAGATFCLAGPSEEAPAAGPTPFARRRACEITHTGVSLRPRPSVRPPGAGASSGCGVSAPSTEGQSLPLSASTSGPRNLGTPPTRQGTVFASVPGQMSKFYVACDLSAESGRVMLGTLNQGALTISEVRRFQNLPIQDKDSLQWNIPHLYQETLDGLRAVGTYEEAVDGISCDSWAADYLLFEADNSLITPAYHHGDPRTREGMQKVLSLGLRRRRFTRKPASARCRPIRSSSWGRRKPGGSAGPSTSCRWPMRSIICCRAFRAWRGPWPARRSFTIRSPRPGRIGCSRPWRCRPSCFRRWFRRARNWGRLRPEIAKSSGMEDARVVASCSHETAAALAGLPIRPGEGWAYLRLGSRVSMGTEIAQTDHHRREPRTEFQQ